MTLGDGLPPAGFGVNTYSFIRQGPVEGAVDSLCDVFRSFELVMYPGHLWPAESGPQERARLRRRMEDRGLSVTTLNMPNIDINVTAAAEEMRLHSRHLLRGFIELAGDLGAAAVVLGPGKANPLFPEPRAILEEHLAAALDDLLPAARAAGTSLWVENMPFAFLPLADDVTGFLDRYGAADLGIVYDVANGLFAGEDPVGGLKSVFENGRLRLVHLSDTGRLSYRHDPIGSGIVPFAAVAEAMTALGMEGEPVLEIIAENDVQKSLRESVVRLHALGFGAKAPPQAGRHG
jgi:sugar phosphate isomerase/epimerase